MWRLKMKKIKKTVILVLAVLFTASIVYDKMKI